MLVVDPIAAKRVLVDAPDVYIKTGTAFFPGSRLAGNGLLVSDGPVWKRQRQLATPAFRKSAVARYASAMVDCTAEMLLNGGGGGGDSLLWQPGMVRDVYSDFNELTLKITLRALFGTSAVDDAKFSSSSSAKEVTASIQLAFRYFSERSASAFTLPESVPTPENLKFAAAIARLDDAVYTLIAQRRAELLEKIENNNTIHTDDGTDFATSSSPPSSPPSSSSSCDLLTSLIQARDEEGSGMDDRSLRDELMTLLVAGQETSAILLGWTCAFLAHYPAVQSAAAEEVAEVLNGRECTTSPLPSDALSGKFKILEAVILESLRVRPPAYLVGRCTATATRLGSYDIPVGTTILVSPYVLHRDQRWWGPEAENFQPERWLSKIDPKFDSTDDVSGGKPLGMAALTGMGVNGAYIPFGAGQRVCIGTGFAMMEAVLVLAAILQKFELKKLPGWKGRFPVAEPKITLRPQQVKVLLRARRKKE